MQSNKNNIFRVFPWLFLIVAGNMLPAIGATVQEKYFAHKAVEDKYGVIAPWYQNLNGQCDFRVRIAAETLKRYPWTDPSKEVVGVPAYMVNGRWRISPEGTISVIPLEEGIPDNYPYPGIHSKHWCNGDYGQKTYYVLLAWIDYYRYTGDPAAISHITIQVNHMLDYTLTGADHPWPNFPISVPIRGEGYYFYDPKSLIQLDIAAEEGLALLRAYEVVGKKRWLDMAKHWGDLFAEKRNLNPAAGAAPWNRYATADSSAPWDGRLTGGIACIQEFLDELIRLGYTGTDNKIVEARNACRQYLRDTLLPLWYVNDTWGRNYWDVECNWQGVIPTDAVVRCLMADGGYFSNWQTDVRNILSIFFNHTGVHETMGGEVFSGAWAYPESFGCCSTSFDYSPMAFAAYFAQYGVLAESEWGREMARRQMILTTYHFHDNGIVEDNIRGGPIVAAEWFKIAHPMALKAVLDAMAWMPEIFGANRENHIMRSSAVIRSVNYGKGEIIYATFDAPENTVDVLRLSFVPKSITADGKKLENQEHLNTNGYVVKKLSNGDCIVHIRHDGLPTIVVNGNDPQKMAHDEELKYAGKWQVCEEKNCLGGKSHISNSQGSTATFNFSGNQVRLVGQLGPTGGLGDIFLDGAKQPAGIDCWNESVRYQQILYYKNGLSNDEHELKIVTCGSKNLYADGTDVFIDAVQYSDATGDNGFGQGGGPKTAQRMIFGYTGCKPYVDSAGNVWLPGTEFIVRSGAHTDSVQKSWWTTPASGTIANTDDPDLYRYGVHASELGINITVGPGSYKVNLKFAERRGENDPLRGKIGVFCNKKKVIENLDVAKEAEGYGKALDRSFEPVDPQNGIIEIVLKASEGKEAFIQALEVIPFSN